MSAVPKLRFAEFEGEWEKVSLGQISGQSQYGMNSAARPFDGKAKYIRITDIDEATNSFTPNPLCSPDVGENPDYKLNTNDLVFTRTGASTGKSYLYNEKDGDLYFAGFLIRFPINFAEAKFVESQTQTNTYKNWVSVMSMRSGQPGINAAEYASYAFCAPSLPEQKKIADFLGTVDEKLRLLRARKAALTDYKKGVMQKIFTQTLRFKRDDGSDFPDWEISLLNTHCSKVSSTLTAGELKESGKFPVYGANSISGYLETYTHEQPYVAIVKDGAGVGRLKLCPANSSTVGTLDNLLPKNNCLVAFLYYLLLQVRFDKFVAGSTIPHIYFRDYGKMRMLFPHPEEQQKIADLLSAIDDKISAVTAQIDHMQDFKKGLLQQMFV